MKKLFLTILLLTQPVYSFYGLEKIYNLFTSQLDKAYRAYQHQDFDQALNVYYDCMQDDPYNPQYNYNVGTVLYRQGKFLDAEQSFLRVLDKKMNCPQNLYQQAAFNLGNTYFEQKKWQDAVDAYDKVLLIDEHHENALYNKALALYKIQEELQNNQKHDEQDDESCSCNNPDQKDDAQKQQSQSSQDAQSGQEKSSDGLNQSEKKSLQDQYEDQKNKKSDVSQTDQDQEKSEQLDAEEQEKDQQNSDASGLSDEKDALKKSDNKEDNNLSEQEKSFDKQHKEDMQKDVLDGIDNSSYEDQKQQKDEEKQEGYEMIGKKQDDQLQDSLQNLYEKQASDDERLSDYHAQVMKTLEELEEKIQKHSIKSKVAAQSSRNHGKKGW